MTSKIMLPGNAPWPLPPTIDVQQAHILDIGPKVEETPAQPGTIQHFIQACDRLEKQTPRWFEDHALAEGVVDYYDRLDTLIAAEPQDRNQLTLNLTLDNNAERIQVMDDVTTRFKMLHLDPIMENLRKAKPENRVPLVEKVLHATQSHAEALAHDLHQLVSKAANYLKEPVEKARQSDVQGFLHEADKLRHRTPDWFRNKGLARSICNGIANLENCFKTYLKAPDAQSPLDKVVAPATPGSSLLVPVATPTLNSPVSIDKLMDAQHDYAVLKEEADLDEIVAQDTPHKKIALVMNLIQQAPDALRQVGENLHGLVKSLAPAIAKLQKD